MTAHSLVALTLRSSNRSLAGNTVGSCGRKHMAACSSNPAQTLESVLYGWAPDRLFPLLTIPTAPTNKHNHTTTTMAFNKSSVSLAVLMVVSLLISTLLVTPAHACNKREWNEYYCKCGTQWKEFPRSESENCYQICYDNYLELKAGKSIIPFRCVGVCVCVCVGVGVCVGAQTEGYIGALTVID